VAKELLSNINHGNRHATRQYTNNILHLNEHRITYKLALIAVSPSNIYR